MNDVPQRAVTRTAKLGGLPIGHAGRATLTKLQASAPPLPARTVHQVLVRDLGENWRDSFSEFVRA